MRNKRLDRLCIIIMAIVIIILPGCKISGLITYEGKPVEGIGVTITNGVSTYHTTTDSMGRYTFDLAEDDWTITPFNHVYSFSSGSKSGHWGNHDIDNIDFQVTDKDLFLPSKHGFRFGNSFDGEPFPRRGVQDDILKVLLDLIGMGGKVHALCGGMSVSARDFYMTGVSRPEGYDYAPDEGELYDEIWYREYDSLGGDDIVDPAFDAVLWRKVDPAYPTDLEKLLYWLVETPDEGEGSMADMSKPELDEILDRLDYGELVPIFLVKHSSSIVDWDNYLKQGILTRNHQVLVYDYEGDANDDSIIYLKIYDPNYPHNEWHGDHDNKNPCVADTMAIKVELDSAGNIEFMSNTERAPSVDYENYQVYGIFVARHVLEPHDPTLTVSGLLPSKASQVILPAFPDAVLPAPINL